MIYARHIMIWSVPSNRPHSLALSIPEHTILFHGPVLPLAVVLPVVP